MCRATSAAPTYFPPINLDGHKYWDGGLRSNNPIEEVYDEAKSEYPDKHIRVVVSIGTGKPKNLDPGEHGSQWMRYSIRMLTDTENTHQRFQKDRKSELGDKYYRFNENDSLADIDMADWRRLGEVEKRARDYVRSIKAKLTACAIMLANTRPQLKRRQSFDDQLLSSTAPKDMAMISMVNTT